MYRKLKISNHMCKRYIERILNISKQVDILKYLKAHQYEVYMGIFEIFEDSNLIYEGDFNNQNYKFKSFYLKDNVLLIFNDNIGVTLYKAISDRDFKINEIISQTLSLKSKFEKLKNERNTLLYNLVNKKNIRCFIEEEYLKQTGTIKDYLYNTINNQNKIITGLKNDLAEMNIKINSTEDLYISAVNKLVRGRWIRISDECLIKDIIED